METLSEILFYHLHFSVVLDKSFHYGFRFFSISVVGATEGSLDVKGYESGDTLREGVVQSLPRHTRHLTPSLLRDPERFTPFIFFGTSRRVLRENLGSQRYTLQVEGTPTVRPL